MRFKRFIAFVIDVFAAILLFIPISSIFILLRIEILRVMLPLIIWFTIHCKDCFNGRSVGKLLLNFQIIDKRTGRTTNPFKCIFRNLFYFLGIVDIIPMLGPPKKRLGDIVTKTEVVSCKHSLNGKNILMGLISVVFMFGLFLMINFTLGNVLYIEKLPLPQ